MNSHVKHVCVSLLATSSLLIGACGNETPELVGEQLGTSARGAAIDPEGRVVLPNWATPEEQELQDNTPAPEAARGTTPPAAGFRVPAEYEPAQGVLMTYAGYTSVLKEIAAKIAGAGARVWMVGGPSSITGVPAAQYQALSYGYDTIWARDYGPVGIDESTHTLGIIDSTYRHYASRTNDDAIPCKLASTLGGSCHSTSLILDGGNYMTDGQGNVFLTKRIYDWNSSLSQAQVNTYLKNYLGATTLHLFDYAVSGGSPADGTGHIDMFAKLLGPCNVLVAQTASEPFKTPLEKAATYFANLDCSTGGKYKVTRINAWVDGGTWYTYTNSLIVNQTVIIPFYDGVDNNAAVAIYQSALPNYTIVGVNTESTISLGGSVHCLTKEVPVINPVLDTNHAPTANAGTAQEVKPGYTVTLDGRGSQDVDGDTLSYTWTQVSGPTVTLENATSAQASLTAPTVTAATMLIFKLVVSDGKVSSQPAQVAITVLGTDNHPPVAHAGADQQVQAGAVVELDASASDDVDGDELTFTWSQVSGPSVTLNDVNAEQPRFEAPAVGVTTALVFSVQVADGQSAASANVTITVAPNVVPVEADRILVNEVMANPACALDSFGEWIELLNPTGHPISLSGWVLSDAGNERFVLGNVTVPAGGFAVICRSTATTLNGGVTCTANWTNYQLGNSKDTVKLTSASGALMDQMRYGTGTAVAVPNGRSISRQANGSWAAATTAIVNGCGDKGTPGAAN